MSQKQELGTWLRSDLGSAPSAIKAMALCVSLECPFILPGRSAEHLGVSSLLRENPGLRREVARELLLHPAGWIQVEFGNGSGQAFGKQEFLWQLPVPPQQMA